MCSSKLFVLDDEVLLSHALNDHARLVHCTHAQFFFLPICLFHWNLLFLCYWIHTLNYKMCNYRVFHILWIYWLFVLEKEVVQAKWTLWMQVVAHLLQLQHQRNKRDLGVISRICPMFAKGIQVDFVLVWDLGHWSLPLPIETKGPEIKVVNKRALTIA